MKKKQHGNRKAQIPVKFEQGWLDQLDGRCNLAKNLRSCYDEICVDLGGTDQLSYAQRSLVERALLLEFWVAEQERGMVKGGSTNIDIGKYVQATNSLLGLFRTLGLERKARDVPTLQSYLRRRTQEAA